MINANKLFIVSILLGIVIWCVTDISNVEPFDSIYCWLLLAIIGLIFGLIAKEKLLLLSLGVYLGMLTIGFLAFVRDLFFYQGGGVNLFPIGAIFLIPMVVVCYIMSLLGYYLKKYLKPR